VAHQCHLLTVISALRKKIITRTHTSVWLLCENRSGKQLYRRSMTCHLENDGSKSIEGNVLFNSPLSLCRSGMLGNEGRHSCNLCKSAFNTSGSCREWRSTTFGTFIAVYMVKERKRKNPIKCLQWINNLILKTRNRTSDFWTKTYEKGTSNIGITKFMDLGNKSG
jgi:hypothetical protein